MAQAPQGTYEKPPEDEESDAIAIVVVALAVIAVFLWFVL